MNSKVIMGCWYGKRVYQECAKKNGVHTFKATHTHIESETKYKSTDQKKYYLLLKKMIQFFIRSTQKESNKKVYITNALCLKSTKRRKIYAYKCAVDVNEIL